MTNVEATVRRAEIPPVLQAPMAWSQDALPRFVAVMRAVLALLGGIALLLGDVSHLPLVSAVAWLYMLLSAALLLRTLAGVAAASSARWLWVDAVVLLILGQQVDSAPWLGIVSVVPVVTSALLIGPRHAVAMALVCATAMLWIGEPQSLAGQLPALPWVLPIAVLTLGPAAAFFVQPNRALRERELLLGRFNRLSDPRQGLLHHVNVLLTLLDAHFGTASFVISLRGPEPRIFGRSVDGTTELLDPDTTALWRGRREALADGLGYLCSGRGSSSVVCVRLGERGASHSLPVPLDDRSRAVLLEVGPHTLALPVMSYGQPFGHLCITRTHTPFTVADIAWLHDTMREVMPLLERSDLLEQLQRETAAAERERIGRDLHDSAVQPYLGLKYGLEALARKSSRDNELLPAIRQLVELTASELQSLRDVVSGLRLGEDPMAATAFMSALNAQGTRFEALYGLKVTIDAPESLRLRGSAARTVLLMINEALTNVRRHTAATTVAVVLDIRDGDVVVRVRNDHRPFGPPRKPFVPRSLQERATESGGGLIVKMESSYTEIMIKLPLLGALG
jgi:signal transduction histidine kinase